MSTRIIIISMLACFLFSCKKETEKDPTIETLAAKSTSAINCYAKGHISEPGSYEIVDYGFVYSTYNGNFGIEYGNKISLGSTKLKADTFSTFFQIGTSYYSTQTYYVRAYLTNTKGTVYGSILNFTPPALTVNSVWPVSGKAGDTITISGHNFSPKPEENIVKFNNTAARVIDASSAKLVVLVPSNISYEYYYDTSVNLYVYMGNQLISSTPFGIIPTITGFSPSSGTFGTSLTITGMNISGYGLTLKFNDLEVSPNSVSSNSISTFIPYNVNSEKVKIKVIKNGTTITLPGEFTMNPAAITSVVPAKGFAGSQITINGQGFNPGYSANVVKIGGIAVQPWSTNQNTLNLTVPETLNAGTYDIEVNNGISTVVSANPFTVVEPKITSFTPASGYYGSDVTLNGENLGTLQYVYFGNYGATVLSRDSSKLKIKVPSGVAPGDTKISFSFGNKTYYTDDSFNVLSPVITSFSPASGTPGTEVTIKGYGFVNSYSYPEVKFGTVSTTVVSSTSTEIIAQVPSNAGDGAMKISVVVSGTTVVSADDFTITK